MAKRRLQEAILAGQDIGIGDYDITNSFSKHKNASLLSKIPLSLDRWGIYSLQYDNDGKDLAVGFGNGGICVVGSNKCTVVNDVTSGHRKGLAVMSLIYLKENDKKLLSAGANGKIYLWDLSRSQKSEAAASLEEEGNEISALDISCDGKFFATAGKDRHIRIYDTNTFQLCCLMEAPDYITMDDISIFSGHTKRVFALKCHPNDPNLFVTAGWDNCIKLWDRRILRSAKMSIPGPHVCGAGLDMNNNMVLSGSWSAKNALQLWDLRSGLLDRNITYPHDEKAEGEFLYCAKFGVGDLVLAGGSGTNTACAINMTSNKMHRMIESPKPILTLDVCKSSKIMAVGGIGGNLQLCALN
ncbi:uncharacterized protein LOC100183679 [Ciona intestinalis]